MGAGDNTLAVNELVMVSSVRPPETASSHLGNLGKEKKFL